MSTKKPIPLEWENPNKPRIETGHKAFDKFCNYLGTGNVFSDGQTGACIRPKNETECNGHTFPEGALRDFDLRAFQNLQMPAWVKSQVLRDTETEPANLSAIFHCKGDKTVVHGYILTEALAKASGMRLYYLAKLCSIRESLEGESMSTSEKDWDLRHHRQNRQNNRPRENAPKNEICKETESGNKKSATIVKLQKIRARCVGLLAIAEKRTPGEWNANMPSYIVRRAADRAGVAEMKTQTSHERDSDAAFISHCAGCAEAGWKATIAAIDGLLGVNDASYKYVDDILAAWEGQI